MKTKGQKRVNANFNPTENKTVDQIKNKAAELIDLIETLKHSNGSAISTEGMRCIIIAQQDIETGCMYAVKANFKS